LIGEDWQFNLSFAALMQFENILLMNTKIWLSSPHMSGHEKIFVKEAFDTNWIAPLGPHVDGLEQDLQTFTGNSHAAALSSGTAALHLALILLNVKPGDLVICQSFTFSASANPIVYQGAIPVFVDSEKDTWNMDPVFTEQAIEDCIQKGKKPAAIIVVHLYGMPAKMKAFEDLSERYDIPLVEDAAEALGAHIDGKMCGSFGKLSILSFNGNKIITTSGGGALLSSDEILIKKARFLATQARDQAPHYQHSEIGYNYRMSNVVAAIGRGQMMVINERVNQRRCNFERYLKYFSEVNKRGFRIDLLLEPDGFFANRWLTTITVEPKKNKGITTETIRVALEKDNIESRPLWKPMHLQPVFAKSPFYGNGTSEHLFDTGLCLPSGSNLVEDDFRRIFKVLDEVFGF
jgi:dTDP-4-amino-4,6-dideoxygalactose transaminase